MGGAFRGINQVLFGIPRCGAGGSFAGPGRLTAGPRPARGDDELIVVGRLITCCGGRTSSVTASR